MEQIFGILAPASLLLSGFGVMGFLLIRDRRERMEQIQRMTHSRVVGIRKSAKG